MVLDGKGIRWLEGEWTPIAGFSMDLIVGMQNGGHVCLLNVSG